MSYDAIADAYDAFVREGTLIREVSVPAVLGLCPGPGRVLDTGCGQGVLARELAARGYDVTGTDISTGMLEIARRYEAAAPLGIEYVLDDATRLGEFRDATWDGVTSSLVVNDVDDLDGYVRSVSRVLKSDGWFVFSCMHPCFWLPAGDAPNAATPVRGPGDYFREGRWWRPDDGGGPVARLGHQHRTLSTLFNAVGEAGLAVERIAEPVAGDRPVPAMLVVRAVRT